MKFRPITVIFDETIPVSKAKYEEMEDQIAIDKAYIQSLKNIISQQAKELAEYKNFFENMQKLLDKQ